MVMSMDDDSMNNNGSSNDCTSNWLGFSLSPHITMEEENHHHYFNHSPVSTGFYGANVALSSPLSVMPLKSDASLSMLESFSRSQHSQGLVSDSSPKLENFLGGATEGVNQYSSHENETMTLSSDNTYYQQTINDQQTQRQQQAEEMQYFLGMTCHDMYHRDPHMGDISNGNFSNNTMIHDHSFIAPASGSMGCADLKSLSLSMSPGSQSSSVTAPSQISPTQTQCLAIETKKRGSAKMGTKQTSHRKSIDTFGQRTSQYRGVTRHRWTGRYEAHLWDNSCKKEGQTRKGRQVYLGGYDMEEKAARAYDCAALKYWGSATNINFSLESYQQQLEDMKGMSRQEYVAHLRRNSSGFSRGASIYRGVTRHHQHGRWQARIGRVAGNKDLYLGTFSTQEEAAEAYDIAAIKFRGVSAVTNFDITKYDVEKIMSSNTLLAGEQARRINDAEPKLAGAIVEYISPTPVAPNQGHIFEANGHDNNNSLDWKMVLHQFPHQQQQNVESVGEETYNDIGHEQQHQHYKNMSFSMALQDLIGNENMISTQLMLEDSSSAKIDNSHHFSDPSSLVTSLSSSREASPDRSAVSASMVSGKTTIVGAWIETRSAHMSVTHLPVFGSCNKP